MTLKRVVLSILTGLVALVVASSLYESFSQPQVTGQLQLYQSDLLLQASEWDELDGAEFKQLGNALLGAKPLESVAKQYESVRKEAATGVARSQKQLTAQDDDADPRTEKFKTAITQQETLIESIELKLGIIATQQQNVDSARKRWQPLTEGDGPTADVANILLGLWATSPTITPTAETMIISQLSGWFQYRVLEQLYTLDDRSVDLAQLKQQEQMAAESKLVKLVAVGTMPVLGCIIGIGVLIFLGVQWFTSRGESLLGKAAPTLGCALGWRNHLAGANCWLFLRGATAYPVCIATIRAQLCIHRQPWAGTVFHDLLSFDVSERSCCPSRFDLVLSTVTKGLV